MGGFKTLFSIDKFDEMFFVMQGSGYNEIRASIFISQ